MRLIKVLSSILIATAFLVPLAIQTHAKPAYAKAEKKSCVTCHTSASSKELNDTGKYYKEHKKLPAK